MLGLIALVAPMPPVWPLAAVAAALAAIVLIEGVGPPEETAGSHPDVAPNASLC
jgi:hypothetical protein